METTGMQQEPETRKRDGMSERVGVDPLVMGRSCSGRVEGDVAQRQSAASVISIASGFVTRIPDLAIARRGEKE
jgi:hypothetical protein